MIVVLGNSITQGYIEDELDTLNRYSTVLKGLLEESGYHWQVINVGKGGENSIQSLDRLENEVLQYEPNYVTIAYGSNDYWIGGSGEVTVSIDDFKEALTLLSSGVYLSGGIPILLSLTPLITERFAIRVDTMIYAPYGGVNHLRSTYNNVIKEVASRNSFPYIDLESAFQESIDVALGSDGHHPTPIGHRLIAMELFSELLRLESVQSSSPPGILKDYYCYPNPFPQGDKNYLWIRYTIPTAGDITLEVLDVSGKSITRIHDGVWRSEGEHLTHWNGKDSKGRSAASGIYLLSLRYEGDDGPGDNRVIKCALVR